LKFLILIIDTTSNYGSQQELSQIDAFNEKLQASGHFVMAKGIGSSATATMIDNRHGAGIAAPSSLNGNEFYSGFWIINVGSAAAAKQLAFEGSLVCSRRVELRPFLGRS
jgi:hypothetical protein